MMASDKPNLFYNLGVDVDENFVVTLKFQAASKNNQRHSQVSKLNAPVPTSLAGGISDDDDDIPLSARLLKCSKFGTSSNKGDNFVKKRPATLPVKRLLDNSSKNLQIFVKKSKVSSYNDDGDVHVPSPSKKFEGKKPAKVEKSVQECRLQSLQRDIEERSRELENKKKEVDCMQEQLLSCCQRIEMKESEYAEIQRSIVELKSEFEAKAEKLKSVQKLISECDSLLILKREECSWVHDMVQKLICEHDEIHEKTKRKFEECDKDIEMKEAWLHYVDDSIRECEQNVKTKEIEFRQVLASIDKDQERKEEELKSLFEKIVECTKELRTKEQELDAKKKLIDEINMELESERKKLLKVIQTKSSYLEEFDSFKKQFKEKTTELESKEKLLEAKVKELGSKKKQFEVHVRRRTKEFESREKQLEDRDRELKSKEMQFIEHVEELWFKQEKLEAKEKELESKEKQLEKLVKDRESKCNHFDEKRKEPELKEKPHEVIATSFEVGNVSEVKHAAESRTDDVSSSTYSFRSLQLLPSEGTYEPGSLDSDILVNLQASSDPSKLVLDIIQRPIDPKRSNGDNAIVIDGSHISVLEQLTRISPHIKPHVREEAMKLALDLKANMRANAENSLAVLGFLLLLSVYGLASSFGEDEILKLLAVAAPHKQTIELFRTLGFEDKISDFVQNLIKKKQYIEAVRFICAYNLCDKNQLVDLLREYVQNAKLISGGS